MTAQQPFRDKAAIITGAASGIGRATALALAQQGADVALAGRREPELRAVAAEVEELGRRAITIPTDVTDRWQVEQLVQETLARLGRLDFVVANAGQYVRAPIAEATAADFERSMDVNFYGALHLILAALPHLKAQGSGHIVLMSSVDGKKGLPPDGPYVAAKYALAGLGDVLRQELRGSGIGVTVVFPGRVDTPLIEQLEVPAISAKIPPKAVGRAVATAIQRRRPEVILPAQAHLFVIVSKISPQLGDWAVRTFRLGGWEKT